MIQDRNRNGEWLDREVHGSYFCRQIHEEHISSDCPVKADNEVWQKVCRAVNQPEILLAKARKWVDEMQADAETLEREQERILRKLDSLAAERQWVITQARRGGISETDMDFQLSELTLQESSLKHDLETVGQSMNIQLLDDWKEQVRESLADLQVGIASLNDDPQGPDDEQEIFELKRQTVTTLVRRITIDRNRELHVEIGLNLPRILTDDIYRRFEGKNQGEIKTIGIHPRWRDDS